MKIPVFKRLAFAAAVSATLWTLPVLAHNRKGDKLLKAGQAAEARQDWDTALQQYEQAVDSDPKELDYIVAMRRVRFQAAQKHVDNGQKLRDAGKLEEALAEFQKAFATDPSSPVTVQEIRRTMGMIEAAKKQPPPQGDAKLFDPAEAAKKKDADKMSAILPVPELKPLTSRFQTLKITGNQPVRVIYETIAKLAGINLIWDPEYQPPTRNQFSPDLSNLTLEEALDYMAVLTKTFWKPLSANTIFLTNDTTTKRRDYEEQVVKSYYLRNLTTQQELNDISTVLRTLVNIQRVIPYTSQYVLVVRGTADQIALSDKLIADLDKPKAEVLIDVYLMETTKAKTRDLGASLVSGTTNGLSINVGSVPRTGISQTAGGTNGAGGSTTIPISNLGLVDGRDFALALPGFVLQALMTDRNTKVLQSPELRATHGVKSTLKIGDQYPIATGSFTTGVGAVGGLPSANTQFQMKDVGLIMDVTPIIHGADEVTMQIDLTVSSVRDRIDVGGVQQPIIGQRQLTHTVRLREGEVSLVGGLVQEQDTKNTSGLPGFASLPGLGHLFSLESKEKSHDELVIALVPHIIRAPEITEVNRRGVDAGTDQVVKVNFGMKGPDGTPGAGGAATVEPPAAPGVTPGVAPAAPAPATPPPPAGPPRLSLLPPATSAQLGDAVIVNVQLDNAQDVFRAPMRITWDPKVLRLNEAALGALFAGDPQRPIFTRNIQNDAGQVSVVLNRVPGAPGVNGSGSLITLTFQALGKGTTQVRVVEAAVSNSQLQPVAVELPSAAVTVE